MKCYICNSKSISKQKGKVRDLPDVPILKCNNCRLVFLSSDSHISDNFYEDSKMYDNQIDPIAELNNCLKDDERRFEHCKDFSINKDVLDFGCGYGGFLEKISKVCSSADGVERNYDAVDFLSNKGFNVYEKLDDVNKKYDIIFMFHVLEHLKDPKKVLKKLSSFLKDDGFFIIEVPNSKDALLELYNSKPYSKFIYWSCHLMVYNEHNLKLLFDKSGLKTVYTKQIQRYPLSNHLYWLSDGKPGGHEKYNFLDSPELHSAYEKSLNSLGCCDTIISKVRKIK